MFALEEVVDVCAWRLGEAGGWMMGCSRGRRFGICGDMITMPKEAAEPECDTLSRGARAFPMRPRQVGSSGRKSILVEESQ